MFVSRSRRYRGLALALLLSGAAVSAAIGAPATAFPAGQIVARVECPAAAGQSYALYLPAGYTPSKAWPVLYLFDPRQRGPMAAELFREAAERYGYILASSNNSRSDESAQVNLDAMSAMFDDTAARFSVDPRRLYAAGMSGGARASCMMGRALPAQVAGVIGCSGGFPSDWPPSKEVRFAFFGLTGTLDFNYREMLRLDARLGELGLPHRLAIFDGGHQWPPPEHCTEALGWMEIQALRTGLRPPDPALLDALFSADLDRARAAESAGRLLEAERRYLQLAQDFEPLHDVSDVRRQAERLGRSGPVEALHKLQERLAAREDKYMEEAAQVLARVFGPDGALPLPKALAELRIAKLRDEARKSGGSEEGLAAQRMLETVYVQTVFYVPRVYFERKDFARAALSLSIATKIHPEHPQPWYDLACAHARAGRKRDALSALQGAVDAGYSDRAHLESDADLESLRSEDGFKDLLRKLPAP